MKSLLGSLRPRRRVQLALLAGLILLSGLAEVLSLGAIVPFLAVLADPAIALQRPFVARIAAALGAQDPAELRWRMTLAFGVAAALASGVRMALTSCTARFNYGVGHELGAEVFRRTLYQPYEVHIARNTSQVIGGITKVDHVVGVLFYALNACSSMVMTMFIVAALMLIDPVVAAVALVLFGGLYGLISLATRKPLHRNGAVLNDAYRARVQSVEEGMGGIRDVLLDHSQRIVLSRFVSVDWPLRRAQASNQIIGPSPRYAVEALGMVLIALLAYAMTSSPEGVGGAIPVLGALALAAQRLMPLLQNIYQGWVVVTSDRAMVDDVIAMLHQPVAPEVFEDMAPLPFAKDIRFEKVSFRYQSELPDAIREMDMRIAKGTRVGVVGATGSGKSTAMDLLLGLLQPSQGAVLVDDVPLDGIARLRWQRNIAHVPQAIYLADASFADNIAFGFGLDSIDEHRVRTAARQAQIDEFIDSQPKGYATLVGERGVRLSGGQRQRLGIARALYRNAKVLVFDEATSALDSETEAAVMQSIESLGRELTIVLIAHRVTTLRGCDVIYALDKGRVVRTGSYDSFFGTASARPHASPAL
jgi:ATP-binding cassette, subfamily B, bacterial PglK